MVFMLWWLFIILFLFPVCYWLAKQLLCLLISVGFESLLEFFFVSLSVLNEFSLSFQQGSSCIKKLELKIKISQFYKLEFNWQVKKNIIDFVYPKRSIINFTNIWITISFSNYKSICNGIRIKELSLYHLINMSNFFFTLLKLNLAKIPIWAVIKSGPNWKFRF